MLSDAYGAFAADGGWGPVLNGQKYSFAKSMPFPVILPRPKL